MNLISPLISTHFSPWNQSLSACSTLSSEFSVSQSGSALAHTRQRCGGRKPRRPSYNSGTGTLSPRKRPSEAEPQLNAVQKKLPHGHPNFWCVLCFIALLFLGLAQIYCCHYFSVSRHKEEIGSYQFDVFLGLRGLSKHNGFTDHLHSALCQEGIRTFRDDLSIKPGANVESEIRNAIYKSSVKIIVISSANVCSKFLDELVLIVEQTKAGAQLLLPLFYHVHPTVVTFQTGPFSQAIVDRVQCMENAKSQRKEAISAAADPTGFLIQIMTDKAMDHYRDFFLEAAEILKKEVDDIQKQLSEWKEALEEIAGLKPVVVDEHSHESDAVRLIIDSVGNHIKMKQSLPNALVAVSL